MSINFQSLNEDLEQITIACPNYLYPIMLNLEKIKLEKIKQNLVRQQTLDIAKKGKLHAEMSDLILDDLNQRNQRNQRNFKQNIGKNGDNVSSAPSNGLENGMQQSPTNTKTGVIDRRKNKAQNNPKPLLKIKPINLNQETALRIELLNIVEKIQNTEKLLTELNSKIQEFETLLHTMPNNSSKNSNKAAQNTNSNEKNTANRNGNSTSNITQTMAIKKRPMNLDLSFAKQMFEDNQTPKLVQMNGTQSQRNETPRFSQTNGTHSQQDATPRFTQVNGCQSQSQQNETPRLNPLNPLNPNSNNPVSFRNLESVNPESVQSPKLESLDSDFDHNDQQKDQDAEYSNHRFTAFTEVLFSRRLTPSTTPVMSRPASAAGILMNDTHSPRTYRADPLEVMQKIVALKKLPKTLPPQLQSVNANTSGSANTNAKNGNANNNNASASHKL